MRKASVNKPHDCQIIITVNSDGIFAKFLKNGLGVKLIHDDFTEKSFAKSAHEMLSQLFPEEPYTAVKK